jgi:hypothetical protein
VVLSGSRSRSFRSQQEGTESLEASARPLQRGSIAARERCGVLGIAGRDGTLDTGGEVMQPAGDLAGGTEPSGVVQGARLEDGGLSDRARSAASSASLRARSTSPAQAADHT